MARLGPKQGILTLAVAQLQHWAVLLSSYTYDPNVSSHPPTDGLSRLPLPKVTHERQSPEAVILNIPQIENLLAITATQVPQLTCTDPMSSKVLHFT